MVHTIIIIFWEDFKRKVKGKNKKTHGEKYKWETIKDDFPFRFFKLGMDIKFY